MKENPKESEGKKKVPMHLLPPVALTHTATALGGGAVRYGSWNWRDLDINASTYVGAIMRHLQLWWGGEIHDKDSGLDHMAHIAASAMIVMDAAAHGKLNYDIPAAGSLEPLE